LSVFCWINVFWSHSLFDTMHSVEERLATITIFATAAIALAIFAASKSSKAWLFAVLLALPFYGLWNLH